MKNKIVLLPMMMLLLAGCGTSSSVPSSEPSSETPSVSVSSEVPSEDSTVSVVESSIEVPPSSEEPVSEVPVEIITIEDARALADDTKIAVEGTVTAKFGMAGTEMYAINVQQGAFAMQASFVPGAIADLVAVGDKVRVTGFKDEFNGLYQIASQRDGEQLTITKLVEAGEVIVPAVITDWSAAALAGKDATMASVSGLKYVSGPQDLSGNKSYTMDLNGQSVNFFVTKYIGTAAVDAILAKIDGMNKIRDTIDVVAPIGWYNAPQLNVYDASLFSIVAGVEVPATAVNLAAAGGVASVFVGSDLQINATFVPENTSTRTLTWASDAEAVATVSSTGLVTGVTEGTANITATSVYLGVVGTIAVTVEPAPAVLESIDLSIDKAEFEVGQTGQLALAYIPAAFVGTGATYASSDEAVATVDAAGVVTGVAAGSVTITATSKDDLTKTDTVSVTIIPAPLYNQSFLSMTYYAADGVTANVAYGEHIAKDSLGNAWYLTMGQLNGGLYYLGGNDVPRAAASRTSFLATNLDDAITVDETKTYFAQMMQFDVANAKSIAFNYSYDYVAGKTIYILKSVDAGSTWTLVQTTSSTAESAGGSYVYVGAAADASVRYALVEEMLIPTTKELGGNSRIKFTTVVIR